MYPPNSGITAILAETVACHRIEARKTKRFVGSRSESPYTRRLVFEGGKRGIIISVIFRWLINTICDNKDKYFIKTISLYALLISATTFVNL